MCPCNAELRLVPKINTAFGEVFNILIGKCASGVNFINVKCVRKICAFNVDEIESRTKNCYLKHYKRGEG